MENWLDLDIPEHAYIYGLFQADANLYIQKGNKGRLSLELSERDKDILYKIQKVVPKEFSVRTRTRDTNFKKAYTSYIYSISTSLLWRQFMEYGFVSGKKSESSFVPEGTFSKVDYLRGLVDGDGSVSVDKNGRPIFGFCTKSKDLMKEVLSFCEEVTGILKKVNPNKRDSMYNVVFYGEEAQKIAATLYYKDCLAIDRKSTAAQDIQKWVRPKGMTKRIGHTPGFWTPERDVFIKTHTVEESMAHTGKTARSIKTRLWRLNKKEALQVR